ncbi:hypothetical protein [Sinomicrobium weinanense]|uniref:Uncharacterized protein n=1 Tax=Sinomicrobium weinanense TaxID=2842200 RepID=A0A926Q578_9FLAO|nr:hypothetical protein [Sinomicrobium weinanense]MBC9797861.1 hypothetical protein [Sinomicrobium weinanense]MBU3122239.1 hypothetical protein [Sinomicrobium weinanense]
MNYPKEIMTGILWSFEDRKFNRLEEFENALIKYNKDIKGESFAFDLTDNILNAPKVTIQYQYWDEKEEDHIEPDFLLSAYNNEFFLQGELLFKVHQEVCEKLKDADNKYFEGFVLWEGENPNNPEIPLYFLLQGS